MRNYKLGSHNENSHIFTAAALNRASNGVILPLILWIQTNSRC
jgi:hypothetical protein